MKENKRFVDGQEITTYTEEFEAMNGIEVEVGTNGYGGGDASHGGRTYLRIENTFCTSMSVNGDDDIRKVELVFGGDSEMETFIEALRFAYEQLKKESRGVYSFVLGDDGRTKQQVAFAGYLQAVMDLYTTTKGLRGISGIRHQYHVTGISKEQFFLLGLHTLAKRGVNVILHPSYCNSVYEYVLNHTDVIPTFDE